MRTWTALLGSMVFLVGPAAAFDLDSMFMHGTSCQPEPGGVANAVYGEPGAGNLSRAASLRVFCPTTRTSHWQTGSLNPRLDGVSVRYVDASPSQHFWCYAWATNRSTNWQYWSSKKFTCATGGGCFSTTPNFTGQGTLSWKLPFGNPMVSEAGISCSIPPIEPRAGSSWVTSYEFTLVPWDQW